MSTFVNTSSISQKIIAGFESNGNTWVSLSMESERGGGNVLRGGTGLLGERRAGLISAFLQARSSSHPHAHKAHISSPGSIFQPRLQRGIKQVPGEVCFGCSETNRQAGEQIKPMICLKIAFVACISWENLIKKYAFDFGDPKIFRSRRA